MATPSSSSVENESPSCPECKSRNLVKDACASEDMLVCHNCGHIVEAGSLCNQLPSLQSSGMEGMRQTGAGGGSSRAEMAKYGWPSNYEHQRKTRLISQINKICNHLGVKNHDKSIVLDSLKHSFMVDLKGLNDTGIAAALVFLLASDQSLDSLRKINEVVGLKEKQLRKLVKKIKSLPPFSDTVITPKKSTVQDVVIDYIDKYSIEMDTETRKECISTASSMFELLLNTDLQKSLEKCLASHGSSLLSAILLLSVDHISKAKLHNDKLYKEFSEKLDAKSRSVSTNSSSVRRRLLHLAKKIPSLSDDHELKMLTITKYLSTILQNKAYLTAEKRVSDHEKKEEMLAREKEEEAAGQSQSLPCQPSPREQSRFLYASASSWVDDDDDSLSDLDDDDIEQYLATTDEIEDKKKMMPLD